ncbi:MAG: hypothetical protein ACSHYB_06440 [Roseibacillus sp.]
MKTSVIAFGTLLIGFTLGWLVKPEKTPLVKAAPTKSAQGMKSNTSEAKSASRLTQLISRLESEGPSVAKEADDDELPFLVNEAMGGMWGGMGRDDVRLLQRLFGEWLKRDQEGCIAWVRSQKGKKQEVALCSVASVLARSEPELAFELYCECEKHSVGAFISPLAGTVRKAFLQSAAEGAEALLATMKRLPKNDTNQGQGVGMDYPEDFDFERLLDGMRDEVPRAAISTSPLKEWVERDPDAAIDYALDRSLDGKRVSFSMALYGLEKKIGSIESHTVMAERLSALSRNQFDKLVENSDFVNNSPRTRKILPLMEEEPARQLRLAALSSRPPTGFMMSQELLNDLPDNEARIEELSALRGFSQPGMVASALREWDVPESRISEVLATIQEEE